MNGVDKLTGELADIAKELSKAIPKGYAELVREYQASFISMLTVSIILLIVLSIAIFFIAKDFVKKAKKLVAIYVSPESSNNKNESYTFTLSIVLLIEAVVLCVLLMLIGQNIGDTIFNMQRVFAPNYYMIRGLLK